MRLAVCPPPDKVISSWPAVRWTPEGPHRLFCLSAAGSSTRLVADRHPLGEGLSLSFPRALLFYWCSHPRRCGDSCKRIMFSNDPPSSFSLPAALARSTNGSLMHSSWIRPVTAGLSRAWPSSCSRRWVWSASFASRRQSWQRERGGDVAAFHMPCLAQEMSRPRVCIHRVQTPLCTGFSCASRTATRTTRTTIVSTPLTC